MLSETDVESECKNCYHDIKLHNPDCKAKSDNNIHDDSYSMSSMYCKNKINETKMFL
ncbi:MAG: hypothetical protein K0R16_296 [Nitrososphaeraceae archaeon]|nr:hypothetical protein [Nitrososphaeraceae archaeon]